MLTLHTNAQDTVAFGDTTYIMKTYYMVFLKQGPNHEGAKEEVAKIQQAHLDNIMKLEKQGIIQLAGPFMDDGELRGIFIMDTGSLEEAIRLTSRDPAVQAGRLTMEVHPWYAAVGSTLR